MNTDIDHVIDHTLELTEIIMNGSADMFLREQCFEKITQYLLDDQICYIQASKKILLQCLQDMPSLPSASINQNEFDNSVKHLAEDYYNNIRNELMENLNTEEYGSISAIGRNKQKMLISEDDVKRAFVDCVYAVLTNQRRSYKFADEKLSVSADKENTTLIMNHAKQFIGIHQFDQKLKEKNISARHKYLDELIVHSTRCRQVLCNQFTLVSHVVIEDHQEKSAQSPKPLTMKRA